MDKAAIAQHAVKHFVEGLPPAALQVLQLINDSNKELRIWLERRDRQIKQLKKVCHATINALPPYGAMPGWHAAIASTACNTVHACMHD